MGSATLSEALSIFSDHLPDIRKACVENIHSIVALNQPSKEMVDEDDFTVENIKLHVNHLTISQQTDSMTRVIKRIDGRKKAFGRQAITDEMIAVAKERPIRELFIELTGQTVRHGMAKCPFHADKTASLSLGKHNRFNCFGCDEKGDTITLCMKLNNRSFIQSVKDLQ